MSSSSLPPLWPLVPIFYLPPSGSAIPIVRFYLDLQSMDLTYLFTVILSMTSLHSWSSLNSICKQGITPVYISLPVLTSVFFLIKASKSICLLHTYTSESEQDKRGEKKPLPHYIICTDLFHCKLTIYFTWASDACYFLEMEWFLEMVFLVYWLSQFSYLSSNLKYLPHHPQSHLKESSPASNPHLYLSAASASFSLTLNMCFYCFSLDRASLPICVMDPILFSCRRSFC